MVSKHMYLSWKAAANTVAFVLCLTLEAKKSLRPFDEVLAEVYALAERERNKLSWAKCK